MKKLFTLLIMLSAFFAKISAETNQIFVGNFTNVTISSSTELISAKFGTKEDTYFTFSTAPTSSTKIGSINTKNTDTAVDIEYKGEKYTPIQFGGASNNDGGANFTVTYNSYVKSITMYAVRDSNSGSVTVKLNGTSKTINGAGGDIVGITFGNGDVLNLGNARINAIFVVELFEVSDFQVLAQNITTNSAYLNVTYTVQNVADDAVYTVYYAPYDASGDLPVDAQYTSVEATSVGTSIILTDLDASTTYTYDVYLDIDGQKCNNLTASIETLTEPTASWTINYAQLAAQYLSVGGNISPTISLPASTDSYTYRDTSSDNNFKIGSQSNNYKFIVVYDKEEIISQNNVTVGGNIYLRYAYGKTGGSGLINTSSGGGRYGYLNLRKGDILEIAIRNGSGEINSISDITGPTSTINLELISSDEQYNFTYDNNGEVTEAYKVYKYYVTENGSVAVTLPQSTYLAYISVNPETKEEAEVPFAVSSVTEGTGTSLRIINSSAFWILTKIGVTTATLDYTAPDNTTKVEYGFGEVNTIPSGNQKNIVRRAADDNDIEYTEATSNSDGTFQIPFDNITASEQYGTLYIKNTNSDGNVSTVEYDYGKSQGVFTDVEEIMAVEADVPVKFFNLQGVEVANPENGIFIKVQGNKVSKVFIK